MDIWSVSARQHAYRSAQDRNHQDIANAADRDRQTHAQ
jgi:hypothetical protein